MLFTLVLYNCQTDSSTGTVELDFTSSTAAGITTEQSVIVPSGISTDRTNIVDSTADVTGPSEQISIGTAIPDTNVTDQNSTSSTANSNIWSFFFVYI